jgi:hypothetical protein
MKKWEYKIIEFQGGGTFVEQDREGKLNELGAQGWEFVNFFDDMGFNYIRAILKREKQEEK